MLLVVDDYNLASLMILDSRLERCPEPYRSHSNTTLLVSFREYKKFIEKYLDVTDYLSTPTEILKSKLSDNDDEFLIRAFYRDIACAIAKELYYSIECSRIIHQVDNAIMLDSDSVRVYKSAFSESLEQSKDDLISLLGEAGYTYSKVRLSNNENMWDYASLLFAMSSQNNDYNVGFIEWSMDLNGR